MDHTVYIYTATMASTTYSIVVNGQGAVPVKSRHADIDLDFCLNSKLMKDWAANWDPKITLQEITVTDLKKFGPNMGFLYIDTVSIFQGVRVPGIVFMRSGAISLLFILNCEGEKYVLLTRQPRVPVGRSGLLELPAGMLDESGDPIGKALEETWEETGVRLKREDLTDLHERLRSLPTDPEVDAILAQQPPSCGMYPSGGGCNEYLRLFLHERTVTREELEAMRGRATGILEAGEVIVLLPVKYKHVRRVCDDAKALSSLALYEYLKAENAI